jgi:hypothetical protein
MHRRNTTAKRRTHSMSTPISTIPRWRSTSAAKSRNSNCRKGPSCGHPSRAERFAGSDLLQSCELHLVHVVRSVRRLVQHFPRSHPEAATWTHLARTLGAVPGQSARPHRHVSSRRRCRRRRTHRAPWTRRSRGRPFRPLPPSAADLNPPRRHSEALTLAETRSLVNSAG